jgi:hypothetical protein
MLWMTRTVSACLILVSLLLGQRSLLAQLPVARLFTVFPPGGKAGAQVEVELTGADLDEAGQLHFSDPAITAKQKIGDTTGLPEPNKFVVSITTNVSPGIYEARVAGRFGISNPRSFVVSELREAIAPTTNTSPANATPILLDTIVNGRSAANTAAFYKFTAKKGQRILIECQASEIDSRMDAALILSNAAGKDLERSRSGGLLDFTVPADGEYSLTVYDYLFRGGGEYFYRLAISTRPHIDFIFPPSGLAGSKGKYLLYGRNLPGSAPAKDLAVDGKPLERIEVEIELPREPVPQKQFSSLRKVVDATVDAFEYRLSTPHGVSNPALLGFATGPVVPERATNDHPAQAQSIVPPCEYVGQFYPQGDQDWVTFEAKKGDAYWVEVFSQRLGLPTDPFVLIQRVSKNDKGEEQVSDVKELNDTDYNSGAVEYKAATRDPSGRFEAGESGTYRIAVRDLFNTSHADPRLVYRLSIRKETPDFRLIVAAQPPPPANKDAKEAMLWTPLLRRGETMPLKVMALRRDNFNGDIEVKAEGLPAGITSTEAKIEKDKTSAVLMLTAAENAAGWVGPIKIVGKAKIGEAEVVREAHGATVSWTVSDYDADAIRSRLSRDFVLAVSGVESAPISIDPAESKLWEAPEAGKLQIPLKLVRRADFNANLKLKAFGVAALDKLKDIDVDGKATNATVEIDLTENKLPAGTYTFYLQSQTPGKYRNNPEAAKAAEDELKQAEKQVADLAAAAKAAPEVKQAAIKAAVESAAKARAASEAVAGPAKAASEAEALARAANEKLASAKTVVQEKPDEHELLSAKEAAEKGVADAESKLKGALEAKVVAEKAATDAQAKAKTDADAQVAAEKAEAEAPGKLKEAEKKKEMAANRTKETAKTAEPRDVTVTVYSAPINFKITPALTEASKK